MSDADDQMGGRGGSTGKSPDEVTPRPTDEEPGSTGSRPSPDQEGEDSFPASDPPASSST